MRDARFPKVRPPMDPDSSGWIGPSSSKVAETLVKLPIPSFTRRVRQDLGYLIRGKGLI